MASGIKSTSYVSKIRVADFRQILQVETKSHDLLGSTDVNCTTLSLTKTTCKHTRAVFEGLPQGDLHAHTARVGRVWRRCGESLISVSS